MILLIKNGHVINPATETDEVADILAEDGKVVKMEKNIKDKADYVIDAKGCYVMPGFIDLHVHLREPGYACAFKGSGAGAERDDRDRLQCGGTRRIHNHPCNAEHKAGGR